MLTLMRESLKASGIFKRDRTYVETHALGILLYLVGLSLMIPPSSLYKKHFDEL